MVACFREKSGKGGLEYDTGKTKIMSDKKEDYEIKMGNELLEYVENYKHSGRILSFEGGST